MMTYTAAKKFVNSLTIVQMKLALTAYAQGVPFSKVFAELTNIGEEDLPEYLQNLVRILERPRTIDEIAAKIKRSRDTTWSHISRLREYGVSVSSDRKYRKTKYWIEKR